MPIAASDIVFRLSGGSTNTNAAASLGGAKSSTAANASLFDNVSAAESTAGRVEYRCIYVHNAHASLTLENAAAWLSANTPSTATDIAIGVGASAANGTETSTASETAAPAGVTFSFAATSGAALALGNILPGQHRAVWLRRTVNAGAGAAASDGATIRVDGGYTE